MSVPLPHDLLVLARMTGGRPHLRIAGAVTAAMVVLAAAAGCTDRSNNSAPSAPSSGSVSGSDGGEVTGGTQPTDGSDAQDTDPTTSSSSTSSTTTTSTIPLVTEGAVLIVANASEVDGAARKLTDELAAKGFAVNKPLNAAGIEKKLDVSKVYFLPDARPVAESVAMLLGGLTTAAMPTPVWIQGANAALGDASVVVMLGADLAGTDIPGVSS
jgi:LytR cell envelope-related transcriptional attenuator